MSNNLFSSGQPEIPDLVVAIPATSRPPKLVLLGDFGAGKSTLFRRLTRGVFCKGDDVDERIRQQPSATPSPRSSAHSALIRLPDRTKAQLCDTCSMEQFNRSLTHGYYRGAACVILVADASNLHSVRSLVHWNLEAECYASDALKILVFSKSDSALADAGLIGGEIESYQTRLGCFRSAVVSSKTGRGIDQLLERIAETCRQHRTRDLHQSLIVSGSKPILLAGDEAHPGNDGGLLEHKFFKSCC